MVATKSISVTENHYAIRCVSGESPDGGRVGLFAVGLMHQSIVVGLRHDPATRTWTEATGRFTADGINSDWQALWAAMPRREARQGLLRSFGLFDGPGDAPLYVHGHSYGKRHADPNGLRRSTKYDRRDFRNTDQAEMTFTLAYTGLAGNGMGPPDKLVMALSEADSLTLRSAPVGCIPGGTASDEVRVFASAGETGPRGGMFARLFDDLSPLLLSTDLWFVPPDHWSNEIVRHYVADGQAGEYRRQAGALYPFLSPMLATNPRLVALIDAGRPFEDNLASEVGGWVGNAWAARFTTAKLRRMRGIDSLFPSSSLIHVLWLLARMPLDSIPASPADWDWFIGSMKALVVDTWGRKVGLDMVSTLPRRSEGMRALHPRAIPDLGDMVERCKDTLVVPLLGRDVLQSQAGVVAARLLLEGMTLARALKASRIWHDQLDAFERALPKGRDRVSWPALFEPVTEGRLRIQCLTAPSHLHAEGSAGVDAEGLPGLTHCVGGFGLRCWLGGVHILSIRRLRDGRWHRSSTVEVGVSRSKDGLEITLRQHSGLRNRSPSRANQEFLMSVLKRLVEGVVPHEPMALESRSASTYVDGVDWDEAGALEASSTAWRPYLPRNIANLDIPGLRAHLKARYAKALAERETRP